MENALIVMGLLALVGIFGRDFMREVASELADVAGFGARNWAKLVGALALAYVASFLFML